MPAQTIPERILLGAILTLAFVLRFSALDFGLPHLYHADEPIVVNHALAYASGDLHPHFFKIPPLLSYLTALLYGIYFAAGKLTGSFASVQAFENLFFQDPSSFYWLGRFFAGVLPGCLTIWVWFSITRRHFTALSAWLNALFLAVCFLHVRESHYLYPDILLTLIAALYFGALFKLFDQPSFRHHLAAGFWIGLAAAMKYNGGALAVSYLFLLPFLAQRSGRILSAAAAGLAAFAVYAVCNPFSLLDLPFFLGEVRAEADAHLGGVHWLLHAQRSLAGGMGWPLFLLGFWGVLTAFVPQPDAGRAARFKKGALAAFLTSYYVVLVQWGQPYARYAVLMTPFLLFFAAEVCAGLIRRLSSGGRIAAAALLILLIITPPLAKSVYFNRLMAQPDVRTLAAAWIETHIPPGARLATDHEFYMPRLNYSVSILTEKRAALAARGESGVKLRKLDRLIALNRPGYDLYRLDDGGSSDFTLIKPAVPRNLTELRRRGIAYVVVTRLRERDIHSAFYDELRASGRLMIEFNPYRSGREVPLRHPLTGGPFEWQDLFERERNGQPILIYQLPAEEI